jgi:hypothetical protein
MMKFGVPSAPTPSVRPCGVVAAEGDDDDVGLHLRDDLAEVRGPVEEVGAGRPDETL